MPETQVDVLTKHLKSRYAFTSYTAAVQEILTLTAPQARRLVNDLIDVPVQTTDHIESKLVAAYLVQIELKFRIQNEFASTLLPFNLKDYKEAVVYSNKNRANFVTDTSDDKPSKSTGFVKVADYLLDNVEMLDKSYDSKDAAVLIENDLGIAYSTALNYLYKARRLYKQDEL